MKVRHEHEAGHDGHLVRSRDWAWRRRIRQSPSSYRAYRIAIGTLGATVVSVGLVLVPLPGPGWLVVFIGLALLASEFNWARRLHGWGLGKLRRWQDWILTAPLWVRFGVGTLTTFVLVAVFWSFLKVMGIPGWTPEWAAAFLRHYALL